MAEKAKTLLRKMRFLEWVSIHPLPALQVRLAVMLVSLYSERRGMAWPSLDQLGAATGASRQGILNALDGLEAGGFFNITRSRGRGHANEYFPRFDLMPEGHIYEIKKVKPALPIAGREKVNSGGEKVNSDPSKGQVELTPSVECFIRGIFNRSIAIATPDGVAVEFSSFDNAQAFIRETESLITGGGLQGALFRDLERLEALLSAAGKYLEHADKDFTSPDGSRFQQVGRLLAEVDCEMRERDIA